MEFRYLAQITLALQHQTQWIWHSKVTKSFIVGDDKSAFAIATSAPGSAKPLVANVGGALPVPDSLYGEFVREGWHGFGFLNRADYPSGPINEMVLTFVDGPDYGLYLRHIASGQILGLRSGRMQLMRREADGFKQIDETRTRGRAALAFAGHPEEALVVYGDNYGNFHAHRFDETGFGKASKIVDKQRNANRVEFGGDGKILAIGGMGYLSSFSCEKGKFSPVHDIAIPVRDFLWLDEGALVVVNRGMHGVATYRHDGNGFTKLGERTLPAPVQKIAVSDCRRFLAATAQESSVVSVYEMIM
jgi:hypothetical protein